MARQRKTEECWQRTDGLTISFLRQKVSVRPLLDNLPLAMTKPTDRVETVEVINHTMGSVLFNNIQSVFSAICQEGEFSLSGYWDSDTDFPIWLLKSQCTISPIWLLGF